MNIISSLIIKRNKSLFDKAARGFRTCGSFSNSRDDLKNVVVVTQLYHKAVDMYLFAIKSFLKFMSSGEVHIINDGSLTVDDISLLSRHIPGVVIIDINSIDVGDCPRGGTWERLVYISRLIERAYVIQLDSDMVITGPIPEVYQAVVDNSSFTIGGPMWPEKVCSGYMSGVANRWQSEHIQVAGERLIVDLVPAIDKYARGCSAFCGFSQGSSLFKSLEEISSVYENALGKDKWNEWGSEQFTSNLLISLDDTSKVLPWPKYQNYGFPTALSEKEIAGQVSAIHFIGSNRYKNRLYEFLGKKFIKEAV